MVGVSLSTRFLQARCAALGFWPGPIDGKHGKRTEAAHAAALASQQKRGLPFVHASGLHRLHLHWTGGDHDPSPLDKKHYHWVFPGGGGEINCHPETAPLAHTLNANSGAIGLSCCGMKLARERPFDPGPEPISELALKAMVARAAVLCARYDIPVSRWSVLTHAEVQPTLGIAQRQKWDINYLPGASAPTDPITAGDRIRAMLRRELEGLE